MPNHIAKGEYNGSCYSESCENEPAEFYHYAIHKFYCLDCAKILNQENRVNNRRLYRHDICLRVSILIKPKSLNDGAESNRGNNAGNKKG